MKDLNVTKVEELEEEITDDSDDDDDDENNSNVIQQSHHFPCLKFKFSFHTSDNSWFHLNLQDMSEVEDETKSVKDPVIEKNAEAEKV